MTNLFNYLRFFKYVLTYLSYFINLNESMN